eukprot:TRINITY_DN2824_c0_g1_i1.p1 TRINITY_DN2824_c0_g1~~TRINITY_DN2824_c0_g1_i1.p1  ORF type:complete len:493 (+),score=138.66 TRINITY_DN2824_c0_g1_i1:988-2466(+)
MLHAKSKRLIMKSNDSTSTALWLNKLQEACSFASGNASPVDSDDESDMYDQIDLPTISEPVTPPYEPETPIPVPVAQQTVTETIVEPEVATMTVVDPEIGKIVHRKLSVVQPVPEETVSTETETIDADDERLVKDGENREGLLKLLSKAVGLDVTTISIPVSLNEPTSFLQRMCEVLCYTNLLDDANNSNDSAMRMMYVATFACTLFCGNVRTTKPFNPYLGETFEYRNDSRFRFIAEQVSHHPPVAASFAENQNFTYCQEQGLKTKFGGNSLSCEGVGFNHVRLKKWNEHYSWSGIKSIVHNVILGSMWLDHFGEFEIVNHTTGEKARLELTKCGWFGKGQYEMKGWILDTNGKTRISLEGKWMTQINAKVVNGDHIPLKNPIWTHTNLPDKTSPWNLSPFAKELNLTTETMKNVLPASDSRLRPDRAALEIRDNAKASAEKRKLENYQRQLVKIREAKGEVYKNKYFERDVDKDNQQQYYRYKENYPWSL